ncbi:hypothetical protein FTUN_7283 [Frigoriglobus tundricola]|uniref:Uncharacterized protein n=1 Tax=Frigoriglobus tundricola TaxID=2774151 RepID=A0A6M5Z1H4_9BACT|nr:hypothetical protein FTUN_7283 [Frigoriglobus tundricola]
MSSVPWDRGRLGRSCEEAAETAAVPGDATEVPPHFSVAPGAPGSASSPVCRAAPAWSCPRSGRPGARSGRCRPVRGRFLRVRRLARCSATPFR